MRYGGSDELYVSPFGTALTFFFTQLLGNYWKKYCSDTNEPPWDLGRKATNTCAHYVLKKKNKTSGAWVKIKCLSSHTYTYQIHTVPCVNLTRRSRCNSSSRLTLRVLHRPLEAVRTSGLLSQGSTRIRRCIYHTQGAVFQARLLDKQGGANTEQ